MDYSIKFGNLKTYLYICKKLHKQIFCKCGKVKNYKN